VSAAYSAEYLDRLRAFLRTGPPGFDPHDAAVILTGLDRYFTRRCSLDEAMGVHLDQGEHHPGEHAAIAKSNAALRAAAAFLGEVDDRRNSKKLADMLAVYGRRAWRRDRGCHKCPAQYVGRIEQHFWTALKARPKFLCDRQVHTIVTKNPEVKEASDFQAGPPGCSNSSNGGKREAK
jgi:hypothetical protein